MGAKASRLILHFLYTTYKPFNELLHRSLFLLQAQFQYRCSMILSPPSYRIVHPNTQIFLIYYILYSSLMPH